MKLGLESSLSSAPLVRFLSINYVTSRSGFRMFGVAEILHAASVITGFRDTRLALTERELKNNGRVHDP